MGKVREALQKLSVNESSDVAALQKELAIIVKQMDDIVQSIRAAALGVKQDQATAALEQDLQRELDRVHQRLKSDFPKDPHRID